MYSTLFLAGRAAFNRPQAVGELMQIIRASDEEMMATEPMTLVVHPELITTVCLKCSEPITSL